jgi:hypothetical protein
MNIEIIATTVILLLCVISIVLSIINMVQLALTTSAMSHLESEIEKKSKEFDLFKKERLESLQSDLPSDSHSQNQNIEADRGEPPIQIVKNIRTGFQNVNIQDNPDIEKTDKIIQSEGSASLPMQSYVVKPIEPFVNMPETENLSDISMQQEDQQQSDVLDIVDYGSTEEGSNATTNNVINIKLYSEAKKDTDFSSAWKKIAEKLDIIQKPSVKLDFNGVMFLYEKEIHYLKKISAIVIEAGGTIDFTNCHSELIHVLSGIPELAEHLKKSS